MRTFISNPVVTRALFTLTPVALTLGLLVMAPAYGQSSPDRAPLVAGTEVVFDGGFEDGSLPTGVSAFTNASGAWTWDYAGSAGTATPRYYSSATGSAHSGNWCLYFDLGPSTNRLYQTVSIPAGVTATLSYWLRIGTSETSVTTAYDTLKVSIADTSGVPFGSDTYSNLDASDGYVWVRHTRDVSAYAGRTIRLQFDTYEDDPTRNTIFKLDDVSILASATGSSCLEDAFTMCLVNGRYRVTSRWKNQYDGSPVAYLSKAKLTDKTGAFWNGDASTYEYMIRFNTATNNGKVWIAIPTFTDVEFWVMVTDTVNGQSKEYHNGPGSQALIYDPYFFDYP